MGQNRIAGSRWSLPAFLIFLVVFCAGQAVRPLTDRTEARYAEIAREMLASGNWLIPTLDQVPHLSKPPLTTWLMAGSMAVFGTNEIAARLPGFLAFLATIVLVARLAGRLGQPRYAPWAAFLYGLSLAPLVGSFYPSTDTLLAFFETAAATAYVMHEMGSPRARWWFFVSLGAAFLTKGPPGFLVPAAVIVGDRLLRARSTRIPSRRRLLTWLPGWLCFAVLGLGWYVVVALLHRDTMGYWLKDEVVDRIFTTRHGRNQTPFVYALTLVLGTFPWWFMYWNAVRNRVRTWPEGWTPLLVSWVCLPLVVFVCSKSRLPAYLLPLFPALTLIVALESPRVWAEKPAGWFGLRPALLVGYAALLATISVASIPLSDRSSWKTEGTTLRGKLSGQDYELLLLSPGDAASLEFYLAPKRITIVTTGNDLDAVHNMAEEPHLIFAHQVQAPAGKTMRAPIFLDFKNHCTLWMSPAIPKTAG
jgi:4-amino-4-deoxy-L-arabinose transferase-like glycosyltransferase